MLLFNQGKLFFLDPTSKKLNSYFKKKTWRTNIFKFKCVALESPGISSLQIGILNYLFRYSQKHTWLAFILLGMRSIHQVGDVLYKTKLHKQNI